MKPYALPSILIHPNADLMAPLNHARIIGCMHRAMPLYDHNEGKAKRLKARLNRRLTNRRISK